MSSEPTDEPRIEFGASSEPGNSEPPRSAACPIDFFSIATASSILTVSRQLHYFGMAWQTSIYQT